jgi:hypothetical protein
MVNMRYSPVLETYMLEISFSRPQNKEAPRVGSALLFKGGVHIGARALHVLNLIWFGFIARLSQWVGGG